MTMSTLIYIVVRCTGSHDDYFERPVRAFVELDAAVNFAERANNWLMRHGHHRDQTEHRVWAPVDDFEAPEWDPDLSVRFEGALYKVAERGYPGTPAAIPLGQFTWSE